MRILLTTIFILLLSVTTYGATKGRILTDGKVSMYKNGKLINSFTQQGPIDDTSLIACDGNCLVKLKGISLIALDQSKFALKDVNESLYLYVEKGRVDFAVADAASQFAFITADGYYIKSDGFVSPASTSKSVKGYMEITDKGTEVGMVTGTMLYQSRDGKQELGPGQAILLAQLPPTAQKCVDDPNTLKDECCKDDPNTAEDECCVDDPDTEENECLAVLAGSSNTETTGIGLGDMVIVGGAGALAAAIAVDAAFDHKDTFSQPPDEPGTPPASPNF